MKSMREKYDEAGLDTHIPGFVMAILAFLSFIAYGKYMLDYVVPFAHLSGFVDSVIVFSSVAILITYVLSTYFFTAFLGVIFSFWKKPKSINDHYFMIETFSWNLVSVASFVFYHFLLVNAADGFHFYTSIACIIGVSLFYLFANLLIPVMAKKWATKLDQKNPLVKAQKKMEKMKKKKEFEVSAEEINASYSMFRMFLSLPNDLHDMLKENISYIRDNMDDLIDINQRHIFKRIVSHEIGELIQNFNKLNEEDQMSYKEKIIEELNHMSNELIRIKSSIDEVKRSRIDKSIYLSKERYSL